MVDRFEIQGMSVLDPDLAQRALADFQGRELSFDELQNAADVVAELYRARDYFTVTAFLPQQELGDGSVVIKVVENSLNEIKIEGNKRYSTEYIRWMMEPLMKSAGDLPPKRSDLQRQLLLLNDEMDLDIRSVVQASGKEGQVDITLKVEDERPTHLTIDYNNLGARFTGRNRLGATFEWGNLTDRADVLRLRYVESDILNADTQGLDLFSVSYDTPLNNHGTNLEVGYANSAFQVGRELQVLDIRGDANVFNVFIDHPIIRGTDSNLSVTGGFVYQDIENTILGTRLSRDNLRELVLGFRGDWADSWGRNFGAIRFTQELGGMPRNDPASSRQAGGGFGKINLDVARVQRINEALYLTFRGHHQAALNPLPFAEQYGLGGINTVRGYVQSAYLADSGFNVSTELRWAPIEHERDLFQVGFFVDHGSAYLKRPFPGETPNVALTGAGVGLHFDLPEEIKIRTEVGFPLGNSAIRERDGNEAVPYLLFSKRF